MFGDDSKPSNGSLLVPKNGTDISGIDIRTPSSKLLANRNLTTTGTKLPLTSCSSRKSIKIVKPETIKRARDDAFMAASIGDLDWLKQTLSITSEVVFDKNGYSILHLAAIHARLNIIKYLIEEKHFNVNLPSLVQGWRPIQLCISSQNSSKAVECLIYLIDKGADINVTNADGQGVLHIAATEGQLECIKILLELNCDTTIKDVRGQTALDLARLWGHRTCAKYLSNDLWNLTKQVLAEQIEIEKKLEAQSILIEVEKAHILQYDDPEESSNHFDEWLKNQGFYSEKYEADALLSHRSQVHNQSLIRDNEASFKLESPKTNKKQQKNLIKATLVNEKPWNNSTKTPHQEYINNLNDFYPRDQYTFLPKDLDLVLVNKELKGMSLEQVKEFMRKKLSIYGPDPGVGSYDSNRPVYYKPKHALDTQTKLKTEKEHLNDEAWFNMCNDVKSFQFKQARKYVIDGYKKDLSKKMDSFYGGYHNTKSTLKTVKEQLRDDKLTVVEKLYGKELSEYMKDKRNGKMSQKYEKVFIC